MRGDSLRDLYAKTLALLGLGLLAAAGALVDYWPVGGELPTVATAFAIPAPAAIPALPTSTQTTGPAVAGHRSGAVPVLTAVTSDLAAAEPVDAVEPDAQLLAPEPLIVAPPSLAVQSALSGTLPASELQLLPPVITASEAIATVPAPVTLSAQNGDNRVVGAAKSIGRGSAKVGGAVARGFAAFAGAVGHVFYW